MKYKLKIMFAFITLLANGFFIACRPNTQPQLVPTKISAPTKTIVPTLLPTPTKFQHPFSILPENADQIVKIAQWGKGYPTDIEWSPDGSFLAVSTSIGTYFLHENTLEEFLFLESDTEVTSIEFILMER